MTRQGGTETVQQFHPILLGRTLDLENIAIAGLHLREVDIIRTHAVDDVEHNQRLKRGGRTLLEHLNVPEFRLIAATLAPESRAIAFGTSPGIQSNGDPLEGKQNHQRDPDHGGCLPQALTPH